MKITIKKSVAINDAETWHFVAPPKDPEKQWKNGRSAKELARFATDPFFTEFIKKLLDKESITPQDFECEPEAETRFEKEGDDEIIDLGKGGPRNHDLLMIGSDDCVFGVEAKVSEKFGNHTVKQEWNSSKSSKNKKEKRIPGLIKFLSNNQDADYESSTDNIKDLQYQLLTATVGTILEAKRRKKDKAIVLVLIFEGNVAKEDGYKKKIEDNKKAFNAFCNVFFKNKETEIQGIKCRIIERAVIIKSNYDSLYSFEMI